MNNDALREKNLWSDMSLLKKQLHTIDMIDEFSKYAKVERKIQKVQNEINTISKYFVKILICLDWFIIAIV